MQTNEKDILSVLCGQNNAYVPVFDSEVMAFRNKVISLQQICQDIEWEHESGAIIPYCKFDNTFCNGQCVFRQSNCPCDAERR